MAFRFEPFPSLPEVILVHADRFSDPRGWLEQTYRESDFQPKIPLRFVQDNYAYSLRRGTVRGLHFQNEPAAHGKLVRCTRGAIFDVAVDIRKGSPTFGRWVSAELSRDNGRLLWSPPGFAHGLQTLVDDTDVLFKVSREYAQALDRTILWNDPTFSIPWPIADPILSEKDAKAPKIEQCDNNLAWKPPK